MTDHKLGMVTFTVTGYCDVCKKEVTSSRTIHSEVLEIHHRHNLSFMSFTHAYKTLMCNKCHGPAMEVPRSYDGRIEMQPEAGGSPE